MSDDFEDLLKRWLRDRAGNDRSALQALAGNVAALPPRRQRRLGPLVSLAASIVVLLGLLVFASPRFGGVGKEASPDPRSTPSEESTEPAPSIVPPDLVPIWAINVVGQLECDGEPQPIGGEIRVLEPVGSTGTASPWPWLYSEDVADLPLEGWTEEPKVPWETGESNLMRYVNVVDSRIKAVIIMGGHSTDGGTGRWEIVAYGACPPDEFDPLRGRTTDDAPWLDANGKPSTTARAIVGPAHCGYESTVWLFLDGDSRLYLRDPEGLLRDMWVGDYLAATALPGDAQSTGLRSRDRELFTTPNEDFVYVRTPAGVERWPRSKDPMIGCG
jgi:hypothetical protein